MSKKILAVLLAVVMLFACATGCSSCSKEKDKTKKPKPSKPAESIVSVDSSTSSGMTDEEEWGDYEESSHPYAWQIITTSANFRDTDEAKESVTVSNTIKQYKNPDSLQITCYHLSLAYCTTYGNDLASRTAEFQEMVDQKYFNTYFLDATNATYLGIEVPIVAKAGATFWLHFGNYNSKNETIEDYTARVRTVINDLKAKGYGDLINGVIWDEPMWNKQSNADFLAQSEVHYKVFGLRNNPVFATGEFSAIEGNLSTPAEQFGKVHPDALKYVTDVGFDSYGVDVRDSATNNPSQSKHYEDWSKELNYTVKNGKDYYLGYKELLKSRVGHEVNYWWFPTAFGWNTYSGVADEAFCSAHLEFMRDDLLNDKNAGGIAIYTYPTFASHGSVGFVHRVDIKDVYGNYKHYPEDEKWESYCDLLRKTTEKFNSIKYKEITLS